MAKTVEQRKAISDQKAKGNDLEVLQYVTPAQAKKLGFDMVLVPCINGDEYCGTVQDVRDVLAERGLSGGFMAVRRPCGMIKRMEVVTSEITEDGFTAPILAQNTPAPAVPMSKVAEVAEVVEVADIPVEVTEPSEECGIHE